MTNKYKFIPFLITIFIVVVETGISFNSILLPDIKAAFSISNQMAQITMSLGLFALGFSGVIYGGISDAWGRRPVLLFSVILFTITSLVCALATNIEVFLIARFFQGLGSGAGWAVGNACLKDIYHGKKYAAIMNKIHAVGGIVPAASPVLGSYVAAAFGWRSCFILLFALSIVATITMFYFQHETLEEKHEINFKKIMQGYKTIFSNKNYLIYTTIKVISVMMLFCEASNIPLIYVDYMGVKLQHYGLYVLLAFGSYILSSILNGYLIKFIYVNNLLKTGFVLMIISNSIVLFLDYNFNFLTPIIIQSIKTICYFGWGFIFGNATVQVVCSVPKKAGMASAMMIALEMLFSAVGIYVLGFFFNGTIVPLSICLIICSVFTLIIMQYFRPEASD